MIRPFLPSVAHVAFFSAAWVVVFSMSDALAASGNAPPTPSLTRDQQWAYDDAVPQEKRHVKAAVIALGRQLFFDKRLSSDGTVSCATCHIPEKGFVDHKRVSEGVGGQKGTRNTPTVLNALLQEMQFWDGRAETLEDQAILPILNPVEMGMKTPADVEAVLRASPDYVRQFQQAFGELSFARLADAITAYERTQIFLDSRYDRHLGGEHHALTAPEQRGLDLFNGKARCTGCHGANHVAPLFSDQKFHNIGIAATDANFSILAHEASEAVDHTNKQHIDEMALQSKFGELGRFLVTKHRHDIGAFKTQTLRNIGITAPYMHDGSLKTLWDVVDHYNRGGIANPYIDGGMQRLGLTESEIDDLVAFLFSLTDTRYEAQNRAEWSRQHRQKNNRPRRDTAEATGKRGDLGDVGLRSATKDMSRAGAY